MIDQGKRNDIDKRSSLSDNSITAESFMAKAQIHSPTGCLANFEEMKHSLYEAS
jgi:hypothetical protein